MKLYRCEKCATVYALESDTTRTACLQHIGHHTPKGGLIMPNMPDFCRGALVPLEELATVEQVQTTVDAIRGADDERKATVTQYPCGCVRKDSWWPHRCEAHAEATRVLSGFGLSGLKVKNDPPEPDVNPRHAYDDARDKEWIADAKAARKVRDKMLANERVVEKDGTHWYCEQGGCRVVDCNDPTHYTSKVDDKGSLPLGDNEASPDEVADYLHGSPEAEADAELEPWGDDEPLELGELAEPDPLTLALLAVRAEVERMNNGTFVHAKLPQMRDKWIVSAAHCVIEALRAGE